MDEHDSKKETSRYNSGLLEIERLDEVWRACRIKSVRDDLSGWDKEIECAWRELSASSSKEKAAYFNKCALKIAVFNKHIKECYGYEKDIGGSKYIIKNREKLRDILSKKEQFVRRIQDESGKGSSYKDEHANEFD